MNFKQLKDKIESRNRSRRGFSVEEGVGILLAGIFAVIFLYFVAYAVPGALVAIATTALTSVNGGVQTIFQILFSIVAVFTFLLILVAVVKKVTS
jgi:flagellar biosynthesis protein FlhB